MPKNPDYSKTIIYKLINYDHPDLVYVGHTTNLVRRKAQHKSMVSENSQTKLYKTIQQHGGWESWHLIKICDFPCSSSIEARQIEDKYMMELKANLNMIKAYNSDEEKKEQKKIIDKQYRDSHKNEMKEYREKNKEQLNQKAAEKIKCECGCHITKGHIAEHKRSVKHHRNLSSNSSSESSNSE